MKITILFLICLSLMSSGHLYAEVKVVTSTSDLAYFARVIGGDKVTVESIASPKADLHFVEVRPSYMVKVKNADIVFKIGLELDMWIDRIIDGSRNSQLKIVDCSEHINPIEVPSFKPDASYGDLHRFGNPHYWTTPENVAPITLTIAEGLASVDPANSQFYEQSRTRFLDELARDLPAVKELAIPLQGKEIITYHNSWPYFAEYFGIRLAGFIEKYPGVAPSPSHVGELLDLVKHENIEVIAMEPYFEKRVPERIAESTGAKVVTLYPSIGGRSEGESYVDWLRGNVEALVGSVH